MENHGVEVLPLRKCMMQLGWIRQLVEARKEHKGIFGVCQIRLMHHGKRGYDVQILV